MIGLIFLIIFIISFFLAARSMKDFSMPKELKHWLVSKKIKGTILILRNKIIHYSSDSSSSSG